MILRERKVTISWAPATSTRKYIVLTTAWDVNAALVATETAPTDFSLVPVSQPPGGMRFGLQLQLKKTASPSSWPTAWGANTKAQAWLASVPEAIAHIKFANDAGTSVPGPFIHGAGSSAPLHEASLVIAQFLPQLLNAWGSVSLEWSMAALNIYPVPCAAWLLSFAPSAATPAGETHTFELTATEWALD